ncbi:helix-turn-helix domain-containing protein [Phycisphaerales bacterium AB-hyl4]|uniref:Helix-turn-helix domain-containing protein n=1 Tax=Natronomicrosphaera hydrolytica TaxID=3242702 RepID=A0ABV4UAP5_9BACT
MPNIQRSSKKLTPEQIRKLKVQAKQIDRDDAENIKTQGRAVFAHHEQLRGILHTLVAERKRQGLSLTDLAGRTGIAKSNLSRLENSENTTPGLDTLERYARAVGKTLRVELMDAA